MIRRSAEALKAQEIKVIKQYEPESYGVVLRRGASSEGGLASQALKAYPPEISSVTSQQKAPCVLQSKLLKLEFRL